MTESPANQRFRRSNRSSCRRPIIENGISVERERLRSFCFHSRHRRVSPISLIRSVAYRPIRARTCSTELRGTREQKTERTSKRSPRSTRFSLNGIQRGRSKGRHSFSGVVFTKQPRDGAKRNRLQVFPEIGRTKSRRIVSADSPVSVHPAASIVGVAAGGFPTYGPFAQRR